MAGLSPVGQKLANIRLDKMVAFVKGDYQGYKRASQEFAELGVKHFEEVKKLPTHNVGVSIFSKTGLKMMKVWILDKFRIKSPAEKTFNKMAEDEIARRKILNA